MKRTILAVPAILLLLTSCTQHEVGILAGIEIERAIIDDGNLDNELGAASITSTDDYVLAAAGTLYQRRAAETTAQETWSAIEAPGSATGLYRTSSVVTLGGRVYASYTSGSGTQSGVYPVTPGSDGGEVGTAVVTGTSADVGGSVEAPVSIEKLYVVSDGSTERLFVTVRDGGGEYHVYYTDDAATFAEVSQPASLTGQPVRDIAFDGTRFWFLTSTGLFISTDLAAGTLVDSPSVSGGLTGLHAGGIAGGDQLWVSTDSGMLYSASTGADAVAGTWTEPESAYPVSSANDDTLVFTDFVSVRKGGSGGEVVLLVGTVGYGYRILGAAATVAPATPAVGSSNYEASALARATILTFHVSPDRVDVPVPTGADGSTTAYDGDLLFAGTAGLGLWKALFYENGDEQWQRD